VGEEKYGPLVLASQLLSMQQTRAPTDLIEPFFFRCRLPLGDATIDFGLKFFEGLWLSGFHLAGN
jgi:hypothetical protein